MTGPKPLVIDVDDSTFSGGEFLGSIEYEAFLAEGDPNFKPEKLTDEWDAISLNYTSGTTGNPKGVVYHHRGAYLNGDQQHRLLGHAAARGLSLDPADVPLQRLVFSLDHGGQRRASTSACAASIPKVVFDLIRNEKVTHMCGAPIVYGMLINDDPKNHVGIDHKVEGLIAGAAPPAAIIEGAEKIGIGITHVYGLTETYGPASVCAKQAEWDAEDLPRRAELNGRQGVTTLLQEDIDVVDLVEFKPVPHDGKTMGEIVFRGNITMKGYLKNLRATQECFAGGWFRTGDLAVIEPDGYVKIKDRSKDIIISGGENISSLEVEDVLYRHKDVLAAAVVATPDDKWGEVPCAFIELREGAEPTQEELARPLPHASRPVQGAQDVHLRRAAQDLDRQDPEIRACAKRPNPPKPSSKNIRNPALTLRSA